MQYSATSADLSGNGKSWLFYITLDKTFSYKTFSKKGNKAHVFD